MHGVIFYCCVTSHHKLSALKHEFVISELLWVRIQFCPLPKVSAGRDQRVGCSYSPIWGSVFLQAPWLLAECILAVVGLRHHFLAGYGLGPLSAVRGHVVPPHSVVCYSFKAQSTISLQVCLWPLNLLRSHLINSNPPKFIWLGTLITYDKSLNHCHITLSSKWHWNQKSRHTCCLSPTRPNKQRQVLNLYGRFIQMEMGGFVTFPFKPVFL